jgi:uncharacterized protein
MRTLSAWLTRALIAIIQAYRLYISPTRMPVCRFTPTCSEYAVTALAEHGLTKGLLLTVVRLAKCGPWHPGGWDPVTATSDVSVHMSGYSAGRCQSDGSKQFRLAGRLRW